MSNWQIAAGKKLKSLLNLLKLALREGKVLRMDETTTEVFGEEDRANTSKSYIWLARGGPPGHSVYIYEYQRTRESENIRIFLEGFCGYLQTDGYVGYDCILKEFKDRVTHVGCFAHARRKFADAEKSGTDKKGPAIALKYIRELYAIEGKLREQQEQGKLTEKEFLAQRKTMAEPVLKKFRKWLTVRVTNNVNKETLFGKAITYADNQWEKLIGRISS
jgi:transposase